MEKKKSSILDALAAAAPKREFIEKIIESEGSPMIKAFIITAFCYSFILSMIFVSGAFNLKILLGSVGSFIFIFLALYIALYSMHKKESEFKEKLEEKEKTLQQLLEEKEKLIEEFKEREKSLQQLLEEKEKLIEEFKEREKSLQQLLEEKEKEFQSKINEKEKSLQEAHNKMKEARKEIQEAHQEIERLRMNIKEAEEIIKLKDEKIKELNNEITFKNKNIEDLSKWKHELEQKMDIYREFFLTMKKIFDKYDEDEIVIFNKKFDKTQNKNILEPVHYVKKDIFEKKNIIIPVFKVIKDEIKKVDKKIDEKFS